MTQLDSFAGRASALTMYEVDSSTGIMRARQVRVTPKLIIVGVTPYAQQFKREYYHDGRLPGRLRFSPADARAAFQTYARAEMEKAERAAASWRILCQMEDPQQEDQQEQPAEEISAEEEISGDRARA